MSRFRERSIVISAVQVSAADWDKALPWDRAWDGSPFSDAAYWLGEAVTTGRLTPHNRGGSDYAQWDVQTPDGPVTAQPGDWIIRFESGDLGRCDAETFALVYEAVDD